MSKSTIQISDLPPEIMVIIFSFCDLETALNFRAACRFFNLAFENYVQSYEVKYKFLNLPLGIDHLASQIALFRFIMKRIIEAIRKNRTKCWIR